MAKVHLHFEFEFSREYADYLSCSKWSDNKAALTAIINLVRHEAPPELQQEVARICSIYSIGDEEDYNVPLLR
jgi:hypothetical protein